MRRKATAQASCKDIVCPCRKHGISVRDGDWKLIRHYSRRPNSYEGLVELFNLKDDLGESRNLADSYPDIAASLVTQVTSWYRSLPAQS